MKSLTEILNETQLGKWVRHAKPRNAAVYHTGNLQADRDAQLARQDERLEDAQKLSELANFAAALEAQGLVELVQRRVGKPDDGVCQYIVVKTLKPAAEFSKPVPSELLAA